MLNEFERPAHPVTWRAVCANPNCPEAGHPWNAPTYLEDCPDCGEPLSEYTPQMAESARRKQRLELALTVPAALLVCGLLAFLLWISR
jgi:hypothetical protein